MACTIFETTQITFIFYCARPLKYPSICDCCSEIIVSLPAVLYFSIILALFPIVYKTTYQLKVGFPYVKSYNCNLILYIGVIKFLNRVGQSYLFPCMDFIIIWNTTVNLPKQLVISPTQLQLPSIG